MAMNDVGMFACLQHEFKGCPAEKGEPFGIIVVTIENAAVEKISVGMCIYKEAFTAVDKTEEDRAVDPMVIEGNPQIIVCFLKTINMVIPHTVIFG